MSTDGLTLTILGSGTSTGVPVIGCSCPVCRSTEPANRRTRCSALITRGEKNLLLDTSTDLRQQALREEISRVDAVLYTHTHADHLHGIDELRAFNLPGSLPTPLIGSEETISTIRTRFAYIFEDGPAQGYIPNLAPFVVRGPFSLWGMPIEPLPLVHGPGNSLGYRIGPLAYLTDCSAIPEETEKKLGDLDLLVVDALRFRPHNSHLSVSEALELVSRVKPRRTLFTHLSHDIDHARDNPPLPKGVELARDGQKITLPLRQNAPQGP